MMKVVMRAVSLFGLRLKRVLLLNLWLDVAAVSYKKWTRKIIHKLKLIWRVDNKETIMR